MLVSRSQTAIFSFISSPHACTWSRSSSDCCRELQWPSLSNRRGYLSVTTIYDMLHHNISLDFSSFFTLSSSPTRSHSLSILCKHSSIDSHRYSGPFSLIAFIFGIVFPLVYFLYPAVLLLSTYCINFYVLYNT